MLEELVYYAAHLLFADFNFYYVVFPQFYYDVHRDTKSILMEELCHLPYHFMFAIQGRSARIVAPRL
jgi:hypothetical protein